ncbi:hypothetical protein FIBSPDRAFT_879008 [Athelia psychrophila]|uniref:Uncharacterized protein n=1 Tax=Athelia psychrophila TaxID=1759441 RepID=A0A167UGC7_9AGAM|nr:hypothetical protein FIBSPDRAFT_879008 [Fibularhizoctonia sp. CBS 109695]
MSNDKAAIWTTVLSTLLGIIAIASLLGLALLARARPWKSENSADPEGPECTVEVYDVEANKVEDDLKWQEDRVKAIALEKLTQELAKIDQQRIHHLRYPPAVALSSV